MKRPLHQDKDERITLEDCESAYARGYADGHKAGHEEGYQKGFQVVIQLIQSTLKEIRP